MWDAFTLVAPCLQPYIARMSLAYRLRAQMRWRGIKSQTQLARISGVAQPTIHRILKCDDTYMPARRTIQRLAHALDITPAWLEGEPGATAPPHAVASTDGYDAEIRVLMARLPADARRKIVAVVRLIADEQARG
ncbi:helix-turn-helix transcriptional regulator [Bordetella genomosp. 13]|uniref:helix-turn-helix domain-containing protein n=1 Tax=Bordetella genomosp. 13 TaxID=463040 RepID=UPI0028D8D0B2|nr:helix-turn-helix transcriptional regulator [Bordetella genomosp. 13]